MKNTSTRQFIIDLALVFGVMLSVKWVADYYEIIGAGSIAIWCAIIVATLVLRRDGTSWGDLGLTLPKGWKGWAGTVGIALGAVVTVALVMALVVAPFFASLGIETPSDAGDRFAFFLGKPFVFITFLVVVIWFGAALGEELLMRGFVLNHFADMFGRGRIGVFAALVVHAVIFGSMHAYQGIPGIVSTGMIAMIFGSIYLLAGRKLMPVILGHGIINTISLTGYYVTNGAMT